MQEPGIAVIDFGSQYTENIAKRFRKLNVYTEVFEPETKVKDLENAVGIVGSGGPASAYEHKSPRWDFDVWNLRIPKMLICYSFQAYAYDFGGDTIPAKDAGEFGRAELTVHQNTPIFRDTHKKQIVWMSHGDKVTRLPKGMKLLASTPDCKYAAAWDPRCKIVGVQFHPEVDNTEYSTEILRNFLNLCDWTEKPWRYEECIANAKREIREKVKGRQVVHLTSGGKDSTVAAIFLKETLADEVSFLHINCGIERKGEVEIVERNLRSVGIEAKILDTSEELEKELYGITDAEAKRNVIGRHYIRHAQKRAKEQFGDNWMIGQGTIWPDHIESKGSKYSAKIKTHHNRVTEVLELIKQDKIIEPNLHFFKDDVQEIAKILGKRHGYEGLANIFAPQHPFPGPGLAIRMLCSNSIMPDGINELTGKVDSIAQEYDARGNVLPVLTVGVQGDSRTYTPAAVVFGKKLDWDTLENISTNITNVLRRKINRVVYAWQPPEIYDIKLNEMYVTKDRLDRLREADAITMGVLEKNDEMRKIQQCPTISLPLGINGVGKECILIRPFVTKDFKTGSFGRLSGNSINEISEGVLKLGYGALLYDVTNKPPGTTEWE